jgi:hypothetical protein
MQDWIMFSAPGWAITVAVCFGIGKRLGRELGPGPLNVIGSVFLMALLAPVFLLYWSIVESPNERRLRELESRAGQANAWHQ